MQKTLAEIAKIVGGEVKGDKHLVITGLSGIKEAQDGELTFVANSKYIPLIKKTKASAVITSRDLDVSDKSVIRTDNPSLAFAKIASMFIDDDSCHFQGIHETAVIAKDASIGKNVCIGPHTVIESHVQVGDDTIIYGGCFIGHHSQIGKSSLIYPNVVIRERISVGNHVVVHSGTVIGSDGFGFTEVDSTLEKIPQIGTVIIEDHVEIGVNVAIDRARFDKTIIGKGTKIDNLVQIGHNAVIGERCIIVAQVGISGSVKIENGVILAGQAGVVGHLTIGEGVVVAAKSAVAKSIPAGQKVSGIPSRPHQKELRARASLLRLPLYVKAIQDLQQRVEDLEKKLERRS